MRQMQQNSSRKRHTSVLAFFIGWNFFFVHANALAKSSESCSDSFVSENQLAIPGLDLSARIHPNKIYFSFNGDPIITGRRVVLVPSLPIYHSFVYPEQPGIKPMSPVVDKSGALPLYALLLNPEVQKSSGDLFYNSGNIARILDLSQQTLASYSAAIRQLLESKSTDGTIKSTDHGYFFNQYRYGQIGDRQRHNLRFFLFNIMHNGQFIGAIQFYRANRFTESALAGVKVVERALDHRGGNKWQVGIHIKPEYQNQGYGKESMERVIDWAFNHMPVLGDTISEYKKLGSVAVIEWVSTETNIPSMTLARSLGMKRAPGKFLRSLGENEFDPADLDKLKEKIGIRAFNAWKDTALVSYYLVNPAYVEFQKNIDRKKN